MTNFSFLSSSELPPNVNVGYTYTGLILNPPQFLPWMVQQLNTRNVNFIRKTLTSLSEARDLTGARLIVNASGLGARELVSDAKVQGVRGQTMLVSCPPGSPLFKHAIILQGSEYTYIIPRPGNGQIVLGGVSQYGDQRTRADESLRGDILGRVNKLTDEAFGWVDLKNGVRDVVGFRPGREGGLRVEREGQVVHAYGAASWGYVYAFGVAGKVEELTREGLAGQSAKL